MVGERGEMQGLLGKDIGGRSYTTLCCTPSMHARLL